jgi:hypothetical protein
VEDINRYYQKYLDMLDEGWSPLPDVTIQEMLLKVQMEHDQKGMLKAYWSTAGQFSMLFYGKIK